MESTPTPPVAQTPRLRLETHYVPYDRVGRFARALCGKRVDVRREHALEPTCPRCADLQAEYEATAATVV